MDQRLKDYDEDGQENHFTYEEALRKFGTGRYQLLLVFLMTLTIWSTAAGNDTTIWIGYPMKHWCLIPSNDTGNTSQTLSSTRFSLSIDSCKYQRITSYENGSTVVKEEICTEWKYEKSFFTSSIVSEWNLNSCQGRWKASLTASLFMIGSLIGGVFFGYLSDSYGRNRMLFVANAGVCLFGIASSFSINVNMLMALRFFLGVFTSGARTVVVVYVSEILVQTLRTWSGPVQSLAYNIFTILITTAAKYSADWRKLQLYTSLVCLLFLPYWWLLPESPHWLLAKGRHNEIRKYFRRSAYFNKVELPTDFNLISNTEVAEEKTNYLNFIRGPKIRVITLLLCTGWFSVAVLSFGLNFNVGNMSGDPFTNMYIINAIGLLTVGSAFVIRKSRKLMLVSGFFSISGIIVVVIILLSFPKVQVLATYAIPSLCAVGRVFCAFVFAGLYVISPEFYSTKLRVSAVGIGLAMTRAGNAVVPYIVMTSDISRHVPYVIFGALAAVVGLLSLILPDTQNRKLPETVEDMEKFEIFNCSCKRKGVEVDNEADDMKL